MSTIAAIDCGTNTIKLLIAEIAPDAGLVERVRAAHMVRLGEGVDRTGRLDDQALVRTFAAVDDFAGLITKHGVERIRFCATSASRDAENAEVFTDGVRARLGVEPEVVSGAEEAALAFGGAVRHLRADLDSAPGPVLVVDIGGGSTELILGDPSAATPESAFSMDIGSVRLHERHLHSDPPSAAEIAAVRADIDAGLAACPVDPAQAPTVVGVAGTVTTVAAGVLGLAAYDRAAIDRSRLPVEAVGSHVAGLVAMTVAERRALPWMHPGRADVIGAGALILERVLARATTTELLVSEADILDGIAWSLV
ncbi:exopolyphosphatase [Nocardioides sp. R-C-SC26]|uniref:Ppx/GppA phosphatase family protein n=1 Tax=Nocardioides sp. R-C-SC26 TaxID=2870414 RepID=UPI001E37AE60|nr:exopolyphosphatase [Nocardioides sp. R-C-SC26]